jgi:hypothetical protein
MTDFTDDHEALVLATLAQRVKARQDAVKAVVGQRYPDGHRETVRSPLDGTRMGQIYRTDPDPQWRVTDREALEAYLRLFPGNSETTVEIAPADLPEALAVLAEHAPHLLTDTTRLNPEAEKAALEQSAATGEPAAPGIARVKAAGALTVKPDKAAGDAVERLVQAGVITWDGRPALTSAEVVA